VGGGDVGASFSDDVLWTTMETGDEIRGRDAVRDFILAMHTGEFAGLAPTGAAVRLPIAALMAQIQAASGSTGRAATGADAKR